MRILFLDQYSDLGGAQLALCDIMAGARQRGWHVQLMAPGDGALFEHCRRESIPAHSFQFGRYSNGSKKPAEFLRYGLDILATARRLRKVIARNRIELLAVNGPRILPAVVGSRIPVVFHLHSLIDRKYTSRLLQASLRSVRARTVCCSAFIAEPALRIADPSSVSVVYNGVADPGFALKHPGTGPDRIGILGRIAPEKGHDDFIAAARQIVAAHPNVRFKVIGDSLFSDPAYKERVRSFAVGAPVDFCGWTDDVPAALRQLDILTVPSKGVEATPRVIMEAMAAGTPVIAYRSGGIPEMIRHGVSGFLAETPGHEGLTAAIEALLTDAELRLRLACNARKEWETRFRLGRFQSEMCELFEDAVQSGPVQSRKPEAATAVAGKHDLI